MIQQGEGGQLYRIILVRNGDAIKIADRVAIEADGTPTTKSFVVGLESDGDGSTTATQVVIELHGLFLMGSSVLRSKETRPTL